jgi:hypothetical protein
MRAALRARLERLEVTAVSKKPQFFRSGYLKTLPTDYVGERHVVIVKREPTDASGTSEWCEFEERPGAGAGRCTGGGLYDDIYSVSGGWNPPRVATPDEMRREQTDASATELAVEGSGKVAAG